MREYEYIRNPPPGLRPRAAMAISISRSLRTGAVIGTTLSDRAAACLRFVFVKREEHADSPHAVALLRPRRERPRRRTSKPHDDCPPLH
jgi:hypothetical protein